MRWLHSHAEGVTVTMMHGGATWRTPWQLPLKPWWALMGMRTVLQRSACSMTSTRSGKCDISVKMNCVRSHMVKLLQYFQVPREKRQVSSGVKPTAVSAGGPDSCGGLEMLDHHLQALRSMPVNLSLNSGTAEHQGSKYSSSYPTGHSTGADGKGGGGLPLVKTESEMSVGVACSGAAFQEEPIRIVYGQSDFPLAGFLKNEQRSAPDSTNDSAAGEVGFVRVDLPPPSMAALSISPLPFSFQGYHISPSSGVGDFHHGTQK